MAQQTQIERVVPKFETFMRRFPTIRALAAARSGDVLREWKGLGYNARAIRLHAAAVAVVERHGGRVPRDAAALRALPGVGAYTAAAVRAFAYNLDDLPIDVNIGRVLHRLGENARRALGASGYEVASALMDLGAGLCSRREPHCEECPLRSGCERRPLPRLVPKRKGVRFESTTRHARGRIVDRLRDLPPGRRISLLDLHRDVRSALAERGVDELRDLVAGLERDGLVVVQDDAVSLP